jgi:hypothetical protein
MKLIYKILIISAIIAFSSIDSNAQKVSQSSSTLLNRGNLSEDSLNTFISFSPVHLDGKTYVRWLVKNDKKDGVFIVERSEDGSEFEALGFRDRVGTQLLVNLFYSYVDEDPLAGTSHYRVMQVGADNTYKYSPVVKVVTPMNPRQAGSSADAGSESK